MSDWPGARGRERTSERWRERRKEGRGATGWAGVGGWERFASAWVVHGSLAPPPFVPGSVCARDILLAIARVRTALSDSLTGYSLSYCTVGRALTLTLPACHTAHPLQNAFPVSFQQFYPQRGPKGLGEHHQVPVVSIIYSRTIQLWHSNHTS